MSLDVAGPARFGAAGGFSLGVEEELLLVDPETLALRQHAGEVLARVDGEGVPGTIKPDVYEGLIELASPIVADADEGARALGLLRRRVEAAGATLMGAGIHPSAPRGDVEHVAEERYVEIGRQLRGLLRRTPTAALHVHVGMPDAETAIRAYNGLREHLPLLQALAANSPFWHGSDSGLQSSRAQLFRGYPRADIPQAFAGFDEYAASVAAVCGAGEAPDYTFLWWDLRPHPRLGTVEVRAMDAQSPLWAVADLAALIHGLAIDAAENARPPWTPREALMESSFRAARDGLAATLLHEGALRPVAENARTAAARAGDRAAEGVERILSRGGGADRQRAAFARGGMPELLRLLADEAAQ